MELNFYTLCVIYLVYSFLGWVAETVVATIKGRAFVNRGVASGPFCFVYGTAAVLMAVGFADLRSTPVALFLGCMANATVVEWVTAKLLERMHRRRWWDYSDKKFNLDGYVCLQYSVLWGLLGMASVLWGNVLLLRLCALLPGWLLHVGVWAAMTLAVLDQLGAALAVNRYAASHPRLEQLNLELEKHSDKLRQRLIAHVEKRIQRAYPAIVQPEPTVQKGSELRRPRLALCHRGFPRRRGGDAVLPGDGGRLDEPLEPRVGTLQRGVGAGAGHGGGPAAGQRGAERPLHLPVRLRDGRRI